MLASDACAGMAPLASVLFCAVVGAEAVLRAVTVGTYWVQPMPG